MYSLYFHPTKDIVFFGCMDMTGFFGNLEGIEISVRHEIGENEGLRIVDFFFFCFEGFF